MTTRTRTGLVAVLFVGGLFLFGGLAVALIAANRDGRAGGAEGRLNADGNLVAWRAPATEEEARRLANFMLANRTVEPGDGKRIELRRTGRTYEVHMAVKVGLDRDESYVRRCRLFAAVLSLQVFNRAPVDVHLCDEDMKTLRVVIPSSDQ